MTTKTDGWVVVLNQGTHHFATGARLSTCTRAVCGQYDERIAKAPKDACAACLETLKQPAAEQNDEGEKGDESGDEKDPDDEADDA